MKFYYIYFSDQPYDPMICRARNKADARKQGKLYIRLWQLAASIIKIEEGPDPRQ
jgi:hypothetical protein